MKQIEPFLFDHENQSDESFLELSGAESSGKTELLLHLTVNTITPRVLEDMITNGLNYSVVFIDTEYKFPMMRFISLIEQRLINYKNNLQTSVTSEEFVKNCLQRFFKINCSTSLELLVTIHSLDKFIKSNPDIALVIIDNICAYHWIDELESGKRQMNSKKEIFDALGSLLLNHGVNIVTTKPDFFQINHETSNKSFSIFRYLIEKESIKNNRHTISKMRGRKQSVVLTFQITPKGLEFAERQ